MRRDLPPAARGAKDSDARALIGALTSGLAVVSAEGTIDLANPAFLARSRAIESPIANGGSPRLGRRLAALAARAAREGMAASRHETSSGTDLVAFAAALAGGAGGASRIALALVAIPAEPVPVARLCELYGLTPAEARTASLVAAGLAPREAARRLGVTLATIRTHLHRAFEKTGARGQSGLAHRLAGSGGPFGR